MVLDINTVDNDKNLILHTKAKTVNFPLSDEVKNVIQNMLDSLKDLAKSSIPAGLAANQIVKDKENIPAIFILNVNNSYKIFINPQIKLSGGTVKFKEACYSVPNKVIKKRRKKNVEITYYDEYGNLLTEKYFYEVSDLPIIIQHEFDHLQGILIND